MAELTLKTRLLNKMSEGSVANLLKGEINFYPAGDFLVMEVGGTDKPFAALASDVYAWAKAAEKPVYTANEIEGLAGYIAGKVQDTNTTYTFTIKEATGELEITSHELNGESKTVGTFDVISSAELTAVLADYVTSTSLVEELSKYLTLASFNEFKEANTAAIADAKAAGTAANNALEAYKTANDAALAGVKATAEAAAVATEVDAAIEELEGAIAGVKATADAAAVKTEVEASIAEVKATADAAAVKADVDAAIAEVKATADAAAVATDVAGEIARVEGLISAEAETARAAEAKALEDAKAYANEIKADLLGEGDIADTYDTLKEISDWIGTHEGETVVNLTDAIAEEARVRAEADTALDGKITAEATARDAADVALGERIDAVSAVADAAQTAEEVASAIDTKIAALDLANTYDAKGAAAAAEAAAKAYADSLEHENTTYTAGAGLKLDGTVFSIDTDLVFILDANA